MTAGQVLILVLVVIVLGGAGWFGFRHLRLRRRFGPEYEQVVADQSGWLAGERELLGRERRHTTLELRSLDPADQQRYAEEWQAVQAQFLADPAGAVVAGDHLVTQLMSQVGYPTENFDDQLSLLSVDHASTLSNYRDAHEIYLSGQRAEASTEASTEELRQALVHYRALFADLLETDPVRAADRP
jgi:hypothetical protein